MKQTEQKIPQHGYADGQNAAGTPDAEQRTAHLDLSEDAAIDAAAQEILKRYLPAFEELAK